MGHVTLPSFASICLLHGAEWRWRDGRAAIRTVSGDTMQRERREAGPLTTIFSKKQARTLLMMSTETHWLQVSLGTLISECLHGQCVWSCIQP